MQKFFQVNMEEKALRSLQSPSVFSTNLPGRQADCQHQRKERKSSFI